jgi:lipid-A-disaccharide synthase-like uncharacterized protein
MFDVLTIPFSLFDFSLFAGILLLAYAILKKDILSIVGQSTGSVVYLRNLYFIHTQKGAAANATP